MFFLNQFIGWHVTSLDVFKFIQIGFSRGAIIVEMFDIGPGPVERISIWPAVPVALLAIKIDYSVLVRSQTKRNTVFISAVDDMPQQTDNDQFVNEKGPDVIEDIHFEICQRWVKSIQIKWIVFYSEEDLPDLIQFRLISQQSPLNVKWQVGEF